jgi:hypothetical protein
MIKPTRTIILDNDILEILHNEFLAKKPYLIRMINFNNESYEIRADEDDLYRLYDILGKILSE